MLPSDVTDFCSRRDLKAILIVFIFLYLSSVTVLGTLAGFVWVIIQMAK